MGDIAQITIGAKVMFTQKVNKGLDDSNNKPNPIKISGHAVRGELKALQTTISQMSPALLKSYQATFTEARSQANAQGHTQVVNYLDALLVQITAQNTQRLGAR